jgi:hypothetical protein
MSNPFLTQNNKKTQPIHLMSLITSKQPIPTNNASQVAYEDRENNANMVNTKATSNVATMPVQTTLKPIFEPPTKRSTPQKPAYFQKIF